MERLTKRDIQVLTTVGPWCPESIRGHQLVKVFGHEARNVGVLVVTPQFGHTEKYYYFYRWFSGVQYGEFVPSAEMFDAHIPSLRACVTKLTAWQKKKDKAANFPA